MMRIYAIAAVVAIAALLGATWWMSRVPGDEFADCRTSAVGSGAGSIGGPFTLVDETGQTVTDKDVITRPTLLYFGYTFCPDVCPVDNSRNAEALNILQGRGYDAQAAFISVDHGRDTYETMADYTDLMHPDMIGLTGSADQIKAASQSYKTYYRKQETDPGNEEYYLIDHSTFTYLVFPEHGFVEFFKRGDSPSDMADRTACFIDAIK